MATEEGVNLTLVAVSVHSHTFDLTEASRERNPPHGRDVDSPQGTRAAACFSNCILTGCGGAVDVACCRQPGAGVGGCPEGMVHCGRDFHGRTRTRRGPS